jgi:amidase
MTSIRRVTHLCVAVSASALFAITATSVAAQRRAAAPPPATAPFTVVETSIADLRTALEQKRVTSRELVRLYLERIATYEDKLNAVITVNPRALAIADSMDRLRAAGRILGPLHGIPVALKDNIHEMSMPTTGGSLAFADLMVPYDATLTTRLKESGAIIIAKTQMTELANWIASGMPANYTGLTGFGMNPWDPRRDPRDNNFDGRPVMSTGGSSSGVGTNVSFWAANVGTETSGSILSPSISNFLVGIKPTVGRVSRHGVIPITADQDTPGPMARTVSDAAIMLGAMEGKAPDANDAATKACTPPANNDYTVFLKADALRGARIGIPRANYYDRTVPPAGGSTNPRGGLGAQQRAVMDSVIAILKAQGAVIVDPADIPSVIEPDPAMNFLNWGVCGGLAQAKGMDADCSISFKYGMKRDFNAWLASLGSATSIKTLADLRAWNIAHQRAGAIRFGQANLDVSDEMSIQGDRAKYEADRRKDVLLSATNGIEAVVRQHRLDALLFPGVAPANIGARAGYPTVFVPYGFMQPAPVGGGAGGGGAAGPGGGAGAGANAFPAGWEQKPTPYGISFTGPACAEPKLVGIAYAFEQVTRKRVSPPLFP